MKCITYTSYPYNLCVAPLPIYLYPLANHGYLDEALLLLAEDMSHWDASGQVQKHPSLTPSIKYAKPPNVNCYWLFVIVVTSQDSTSSRLLPGSSYSCCIRNLHALVHKQCHPVHITTAHAWSLCPVGLFSPRHSSSASNWTPKATSLLEYSFISENLLLRSVA
jgi:hypothetical protein